MSWASSPSLGELRYLLLVVGGAEDRLLEDRRVGGHAAQRVLLDEPLELAAGDQAAADLVEPDARAGRRQRRKPLVRLRADAHARAPSRSTTARARAATFSGVKPKCSYRSFCGAEAPNVVMPTRVAVLGDPLAPAERRRRLHRHPRAHARRQHAVAVVGVLLGEALQAGRRDHARGEPLRLEQVGRGRADVHLGAGADQDHVRLALPERVAQHVGAAVDRVVGDARSGSTRAGPAG